MWHRRPAGGDTGETPVPQLQLGLVVRSMETPACPGQVPVYQYHQRSCRSPGGPLFFHVAGH